MRYCSDTWFLLMLFGKDNKAVELFQKIEREKDFLFVSFITYAETTKILFQRGHSESRINDFFINIEGTRKVNFIPIDKDISKESAKISLSYSIPLIDSIVAATAKLMNCHILLSADSDYLPLAKKKYIKVQSW